MRDHKIRARQGEAKIYRLEARYLCPKAARRAKAYSKYLTRKALRLEARLFIEAGLEELEA